MPRKIPAHVQGELAKKNLEAIYQNKKIQDDSPQLSKSVEPDDGPSVINNDLNQLDNSLNNQDTVIKGSNTEGLLNIDNNNLENLNNSLFPKSDEVNTQLLQAGLNNEQVELVYNIANKQVQPAIKQLAENYKLESKFKLDQHKLELKFGGHDNWQRMKSKIANWAETNLPKDAVNTLSNSYEGVLAIVKLMQPNPSSGLNSRVNTDDNSLSALKAKMNDPRYWRDFDPKYRQNIKQGFENIYKTNDDIF